MLHSGIYVPGALSEDREWQYYNSGRRDAVPNLKLSSFAFNPNASEFVPRGGQQGHVKSTARRNGKGELATVPNEILVQILRHIDSAKDLVRLACTCKHLKSVIPAAPVQVKLTKSLSIEQEPYTAGQGSQLRSSVHGSPATVKQQLSHIAATLSGITALDIAHTPCSDADVACTIARLPRLQSLRLDNCRKLSASICATVFSQAHCRLHTLCLQRCFQVTSATLVDALTAAQQPNSELVTLTLSHIHFLGPLISLHKPHDTASLQVCLETSDTKSACPGNGPADDAVPQVDSVAVAAAAGHTQNSVNTAVKPPDSPALPLPQPLPLPRRSESAMPLQGSSLRVLALSCCDELGLAHLASIASCTPALRVLLLGGTAMALPVATAPAVRPWRPASATREPAALTVYRQERAVLVAVEKLVQRMWAALVHEDAVAAAETAGNAAHAGPAAEEPSVVEAGADGTRRPVSAISMYTAAPSLAGLRMLSDPELPADCDAEEAAAAPAPHLSPRSRAAAALLARRGAACTLGPQSIMRAAGLVHAALLFPALEVLEVSHVPAAVAELVRRTLASPDLARVSQLCTSGGGVSEPAARAEAAYQVSTEHAHRLEVWNLCSLADARRAERAHDSEPDVAAAVRAAARSSGPARLTALHIAALDGVPELAVILLRLGAAINARSKSGATALFAACEAGHAPVVRTLLQAGADMWIPTASHENCLYIAALKGNSEVVEELLRRCQQDGVAWVDKARYGDGWTPLMCCVVGGRVTLAAALLRAAQPRAHDLLLARNRHGQTALHLAAYRGAADMIKLLLRYQGRSAVRERDAAGLTPAQVARKHSHSVAEALLTRRHYVAA